MKMTRVKRKNTRNLQPKTLLNSRRTTANIGTTTTTPITFQKFRIRKCVVKVKRIKLHVQNAASHKPVTPRKLRNRTLREREVHKTPMPGAQFVEAAAHDCEVTSFEPARNSTMSVGLTSAVATVVERAHKMRTRAKKPTALEPTEKKVKGLTRKTPQTAIRKATESTPKHTPVPTRKDTTEQIAAEPKTTEIQPEKEKGTGSKREQRFFHRMQPPSRTRSEVTRNVYEYLSETEINDNEENKHVDPAADIIEKLLKDGKACAIMRQKTGKMRKRPEKKKVRPIGKRRQCSLKSVAEEVPNDGKDVKQAKKVEDPRIELPLSPIYEPEMDFMDEVETFHEAEQLPVHDQSKLPLNIKSMDNGGYSPLACSLFLSQNKHQSTADSLKRLQQLDQVRKYISTPMNRKNENRPNNTAISPIVNQSHRTPATSVRSPRNPKSPWRVTDVILLPNRNVFGRNTSSRRHVYVPDGNDSKTIESHPVKPVQRRKSIMEPFNDGNGMTVQRNESATESFGNDSNGENLPPPLLANSTVKQPSEDQQQEDAENYLHLPNPRRTLQHRSPLKDINILDVVMLPSWKKNVQLAKTPTRPSMLSNLDRVAFNSPKSPVQQASAKKRQTDISISSPRNLFGFEEFLSGQELESGNENTIDQQHSTLRGKLQRIRHLRPTVRDLLTTSKAPTPDIPGALSTYEPRQHNIKDMLCSTMIAKTLPSRTVDQSMELFTNPDPEVTFDEKQPRRTYVREKPKRRRKQRVHVLFIDTDSSEGEDNEQDSSESPKKLMPALKRSRKDLENEHKLQQFVKSFNQECEEIEKYTPIIE